MFTPGRDAASLDRPQRQIEPGRLIGEGREVVSLVDCARRGVFRLDEHGERAGSFAERQRTQERAHE